MTDRMQTRGESIKGQGFTLSEVGLKRIVAEALWYGAYSFVIAKPECSLDEFKTYLGSEIRLEYHSVPHTKKIAYDAVASADTDGSEPVIALRAFRLLGEAGFLGEKYAKS